MKKGPDLFPHVAESNPIMFQMWTTCAGNNFIPYQTRRFGFFLMICKCYVLCEIIFLLSLLFFRIIVEMPAARSSVNMRRDKTLVGILCKGCTKVFKTSFSFDQHRRSVHGAPTACYSLPEKTRSNLYAVKRHNISTATLQETAFHRSRGCKPELHILHIIHISHILHIAEN